MANSLISYPCQGATILESLGSLRALEVRLKFLIFNSFSAIPKLPKFPKLSKTACATMRIRVRKTIKKQRNYIVWCC